MTSRNVIGLQALLRTLPQLQIHGNSDKLCVGLKPLTSMHVVRLGKIMLACKKAAGVAVLPLSPC